MNLNDQEYIVKPINNIIKKTRYLHPEKKKKLKLVILLASIWFVVTLPLPWVVNNPNIPESALVSVVAIIGVISIPFVILGIVWTLKPELTT